MLLDDIFYVALLLACIAFGSVFCGLNDPGLKKWTSTIVGIIVTVIVSGSYVIHPILMTLGSALMFTLVPGRIRHIVVFSFSFFYLLGIYRLIDWHGSSAPSTHTNLILMMMTLKYAGLGFEIKNTVEEFKGDPENESYKALINVGFTDVVHYGFSYMGVLTGPYYRYRTYWDCVNRNLGNYVDCWEVTLYKLKLIAVLSVVYLLSNYIFPGSYVLTDEFHECSFLYRVWYVYPAFISFRTRLYAGMTFSECVCQMAGLGAYPISTEPKSGRGPKDYKLANEIMIDPRKLKDEKFDFETVRAMNIWGVETCHLVRNAMKFWNITVQYWLATYVYKTFPNKALRAPAVFILSAAWHGYALGYYVAISSVVFFLPVEDIYVKFYNQSTENSIVQKGLWALLYFMRLTAMAYLSFAMQLLSFDNVLIYYNSIFWSGHILAVILYVVGRLLKPYLMNKIESKKC